MAGNAALFSKIHDICRSTRLMPRCLVGRLADSYRTRRPFPHIVIDDFIDPAVLKAVLAGFPSNDEKEFFDRDQERFKFQFQPLEVSSGVTRNLFAEFNGQAFLGFLEELTGFDGLVSDPYFIGGGLHETKRGGHLGVHADFNVHGGIKLERKINLLIYLNEDWDPSFGGQLELWDRQMKRVRRARRATVRKSRDLQHGAGQLSRAPDPLNCPPIAHVDRSRPIIMLHSRMVWPLPPNARRTSILARRPVTSEIGRSGASTS